MNLQSRLSLIKQVQSNKDGHKRNAEDTRKLIEATRLQIERELELVELIERTAHSIETSVDDLIAHNEAAPAYVREQYEQLHRAHTRLSFLVSAIQPNLQAAE
jgi:hypothetical protein